MPYPVQGAGIALRSERLTDAASDTNLLEPRQSWYTGVTAGSCLSEQPCKLKAAASLLTGRAPQSGAKAAVVFERDVNLWPVEGQHVGDDDALEQ